MAISELESAGIGYQLDNGGSTIEVTSSNADQARLTLADAGVGSADVVGWSCSTIRASRHRTSSSASATSEPCKAS